MKNKITGQEQQAILSLLSTVFGKTEFSDIICYDIATQISDILDGEHVNKFVEVRTLINNSWFNDGYVADHTTRAMFMILKRQEEFIEL
jgi:hypothetical protein